MHTQPVLLSIVVPIYNEDTTIPVFHKHLNTALKQLPIEIKVEILYVNDGSHDQSAQVLQDLQQQDQRVGFLEFSRNFGKEIALSAGLDYAKGDAVVVIDVDLQHPPELIIALYQQWQAGFDMVYAKRLHRQDETIVKKIGSRIFYSLLNKLTLLPIPEDAGDFRLLDRKLVDHLKQLREHHRFMKGLFTWLGYKQSAITYEAAARSGGSSKWNYKKLVSLAIEGLTSFSITPLRLSTYLGFTIACSAFLYGLWIIYKTIAFGELVRGYPSLMVAILFLGGVQLIAIGVLGEYIGRIFMETKQRPLYLVKDHKPASQF